MTKKSRPKAWPFNSKRGSTALRRRFSTSPAPRTMMLWLALTTESKVILSHIQSVRCVLVCSETSAPLRHCFKTLSIFQNKKAETLPQVFLAVLQLELIWQLLHHIICLYSFVRVCYVCRCVCHCVSCACVCMRESVHAYSHRWVLFCCSFISFYIPSLLLIMYIIGLLVVLYAAYILLIFIG